jgi:GNAT superfamily N-acetyltransferase
VTSGLPAIRPATTTDLPTIADIFAANDEPVTTHTGETPYLDSLLAIARVLVAERDGAVAGFGAVVPVGPISHLADLFVRPASHGTGVGKALLVELYGEAWPRTTFSSDDPRALPLYVRSGMQPGWPNLYLLGEAPRVPSTSLAAGPGSVDVCLALELAATGRERAAIQWTRGRPGSERVVLRDAAGRTSGFAIVRERWRGPGRAVDRVVPAPEASRRASGSSTATRTWPASPTSWTRRARWWTRRCSDLGPRAARCPIRFASARPVISISPAIAVVRAVHHPAACLSVRQRRHAPVAVKIGSITFPWRASANPRRPQVASATASWPDARVVNVMPRSPRARRTVRSSFVAQRRRGHEIRRFGARKQRRRLKAMA